MAIARIRVAYIEPAIALNWKYAGNWWDLELEKDSNPPTFTVKEAIKVFE